jgi:hypothetical protein
MNCFEYGVQSHVLDLPMGDLKAEEAKIKHRQSVTRTEQIALRKSQQDKDPDDLPTWGRRGGRTLRRGGY